MIHLILLLGIVFLSLYVLGFLLNCYFHKKNKQMPFYTIITVKNNEDCIEGIVRSIIKEFGKLADFSSVQILIADINSSDSTPIIVEKLSKKYPCVSLLTFEEVKPKEVECPKN